MFLASEARQKHTTSPFIEKLQINFAAALRLTSQPVAFVGASGKTTAIFALARSLGHALVTTTTHLGTWQSEMADQHWVCADKDFPSFLEGLEIAAEKKDGKSWDAPGVILVTGPATPDDRLPGVSAANLALLHRLAQTHARPLLIEADGARQLPLKAPAAHEPVIPAFVETVVVVAGLSALGQPLTSDWVHRPEIFAALSGLASGSTITPAALMKMFTHPAGGLKNIPPTARRIVLLTQADTPTRQSIANRLAPELLAHYDAVLVTAFEPANPSVNSGQALLARYEPTAAIILAAGAATRYGQPKQLLDWEGEPLVRRTAHTALAAGLSPVIVVIGANAEAVESALTGLPVLIARCQGWAEGQAASIRSGLHALQGQVGRDARLPGSAIFLLADQPYVNPTLLRALAETHARTLAPIIAPLVDGRRANPVLFDQVTFSDLLMLTGDVGGRALFSRYPITWMPWLDSAVLLDVDTPADYAHALQPR